LIRLIRKKKAAAAPIESYLPATLKAAEAAAEKKAKHIKAYDVRGLTLVADSFLLCTATSEPQLKAIFNAVREGMRAVGKPPLRTEGAFGDGWVLLDYGDVIVHIFREAAREFYDLDGLWGDAPEIPLNLD
jgi:ribosome-associated protein